MKMISVWQPWASLIIYRHKFIETRGWPAPQSLIGQRIGIASTKVIRPEQRVTFLDPDFQRYYAATGGEDLDDLPHGFALGTALLYGCEPITDELIEDITDEEQAFGWFHPGRFAWRLRSPEPFKNPVPVRGMQGLWDWSPDGEVVPFMRTGEARP